MIKKISALALSAAISFSAISAFAATNFSDFDSSHWAYSVVNTLVDEGTINGYGDGTFKPNGLVTRAEFVKMIGKGNSPAAQFSDIEGHWAYDYIVTSGLAASYGDVFEPDRPITRGETAPVLHLRAGQPETAEVPANVASQIGKYDADAVSWTYNTGILVGNDGVTLRLDDTLTRAEAAALIIKARQAAEQVVYSADSLELAYNSFAMFDTPYSETGTITNGEMARVALRLACREYQMTYVSFVNATPAFEHEYARDLAILAEYSLIDKSKLSAAYADKAVTKGDAEKMLSIAYARRSAGEIEYTPSENSETATHADIAAMLIKFNNKIGIQTAMTTNIDELGRFETENVKIVTDVSKMPSNYGEYQAVLQGVPSSVYEFELADANPADAYIFALDFLEMFVRQATKLVEGAKKEFGMDITVTCYPTLIYDDGTGFAMRIKCTVNKANGQVTPAMLFGESAITDKETVLKNGSEFFADVKFGTYMIAE